MTWSKFGAEYSDSLANLRLSDAAYRTHTEAIQWIYNMESKDLRIGKEMIRRFAASDLRDSAVRELVDKGLWAEQADAYLIKHHGDVIRQSIRAQQLKRTRDRESQRSSRARKVSTDVSDDASADVSTEASADVSAAVSSDTDRQTNSHRPKPPSKQPFLGCATCQRAIVFGSTCPLHGDAA